MKFIREMEEAEMATLAAFTISSRNTCSLKFGDAVVAAGAFRVQREDSQPCPRSEMAS